MKLLKLTLYRKEEIFPIYTLMQMLLDYLF